MPANTGVGAEVIPSLSIGFLCAAVASPTRALEAPRRLGVAPARRARRAAFVAVAGLGRAWLRLRLGWCCRGAAGARVSARSGLPPSSGRAAVAAPSWRSLRRSKDGMVWRVTFWMSLQQVALVVGAEGHGRAVGAGAGRAADPVDVGFRHVGQLVLDDVADRVDVDAARGDVGGDQGADLAGLERRPAPVRAGPGSCRRGSRRRRRRPAPGRVATRSAPRLVRVKTMTRLKLGVVEQLGQQGALARLPRRTGRAGSTRSTVVACGRHRDLAADRCSSSPASLPISVGMVAEKNRFCRCLRQAWRRSCGSAA